MAEELQEISFDEDIVAKTVYVDFGIRSDVLDPQTVTTMLEIQPTRAWAKNEVYSSKTLDLATQQVVAVLRKRPWGIWAIDSKAFTASKRVEAHLLYLLNLLEPRQEEINFFVNRPEEYTVSFYIRWEPKSGHGSYEISNTTLGKMAALCHYTEFSFL